jgi:hypothetical protein
LGAKPGLVSSGSPASGVEGVDGVAVVVVRLGAVTVRTSGFRLVDLPFVLGPALLELMIDAVRFLLARSR